MFSHGCVSTLSVPILTTTKAQATFTGVRPRGPGTAAEPLVDHGGDTRTEPNGAQPRRHTHIAKHWRRNYELNQKNLFFLFMFFFFFFGLAIWCQESSFLGSFVLVSSELPPFPPYTPGHLFSFRLLLCAFLFFGLYNFFSCSSLLSYYTRPWSAGWGESVWIKNNFPSPVSKCDEERLIAPLGRLGSRRFTGTGYVRFFSFFFSRSFNMLSFEQQAKWPLITTAHLFIDSRRIFEHTFEGAVSHNFFALPPFPLMDARYLQRSPVFPFYSSHFRLIPRRHVPFKSYPFFAFIVLLSSFFEGVCI